jgi:hypothetical protein
MIGVSIRNKGENPPSLLPCPNLYSIPNVNYGPLPTHSSMSVNMSVAGRADSTKCLFLFTELITFVTKDLVFKLIMSKYALIKICVIAQYNCKKVVMVTNFIECVP